MAFTTYSVFGNIHTDHRQDLRIYLQALHQRYPKLRGLYHEENKKYNYTPEPARKFVTKQAQTAGNEKYPPASFIIVESLAYAKNMPWDKKLILVCMDRPSWRMDFDNVISALEGTGRLVAA